MKESYGELYRRLRQGKKKSLNDIASVHVSKSFLSKFERGESEISFGRLIIILKALNVTLKEFSQLIDGSGEHVDMEAFIKDASIYYFTNDQKGLTTLIERENKYYQLSGDETHYHKYLVALTFLCDLKGELLPQEESQRISDYLFGLDYWGTYENIILATCLGTMNLQTTVLLTDELISKKHVYGSSEEDVDLKLTLIFNTIFTCLRERRIDLCKHYIEIVKDFGLSDKLIYYKFLLKYFSIICDKASSYEDVEKLCEFLELTESYQYRDSLLNVARQYYGVN